MYLGGRMERFSISGELNCRRTMSTRCGRIGISWTLRYKEFNEMGIASLLLDSFSGRGLVSTSADQALLGRLNMILDAYRAFDVLAAHPRIDAARIAVIGFSRGGQSALYSSLRRFQQMWNP